MRFARLTIAFVVGLMLSALGAEVVLRALPVNMGLYRTNRHDLWPLHAYEARRNFTFSMSWQMLHSNRGATNNYGHFAPFDYVPGVRPVVVIGDSFVEGLMNRYEDTLQGELGRMLGSARPVYGLGFSGNSLAEYLATARMAKREFAPDAMIFLIIDNDVKESWSNRTGHRFFSIDQNTVREGYLPLDTMGLGKRLRQIIGDSALYRYVQANVGFSVEGVLARRTQPKREASLAPTVQAEKMSRTAVDYFLGSLPGAAGVPVKRLVLVFDSDREKIYDPSRVARRAADTPEIQAYFENRAKELGFSVLDTRPLFSAHYYRYRTRFDYTPTDRHWNGLANWLVARELFMMLAPGPQQGSTGQSSCEDSRVGRCEGISSTEPPLPVAH